jgi:hypothetical protein
VKGIKMKNYYLIFITVVVLFSSQNSYGYLDAGTGSYFIQIVIGFIAAGIFSLKLFWKRILSIFKPSEKKSPRSHEKNK